MILSLDCKDSYNLARMIYDYRLDLIKAVEVDITVIVSSE